VGLGESGERQHFEIAEITMREQIGSALCPCSSTHQRAGRASPLKTTLNDGYGGLLAKYRWDRRQPQPDDRPPAVATWSR